MYVVLRVHQVTVLLSSTIRPYTKMKEAAVLPLAPTTITVSPCVWFRLSIIIPPL